VTYNSPLGTDTEVAIPASITCFLTCTQEQNILGVSILLKRLYQEVCYLRVKIKDGTAHKLPLVLQP